MRWILFETAVRKRSQAADLSAFFPVERTLSPHSECARSKWGIGFRNCLLITWGPMSFSSILDAVCYHLLGPVSLFLIFANLCFGGELVARMHFCALVTPFCWKHCSLNQVLSLLCTISGLFLYLKYGWSLFVYLCHTPTDHSFECAWGISWCLQIGLLDARCTATEGTDFPL